MTTDPDLLLQRFVDQELSPDERIRFVAELGRSDALRQRTIELEQLLLNVGELPRPLVPPGFAARVMEGIGPAPSIMTRLADVLFAARDLRWNLASAVGTLALVALVMAGLVTGGLQQAPPATVAGAPGVAAAPSATVSVRLVVVQPDARTVQLAGDFNGWNPSRTPLEQASNGAWTVTIALEPGRYEYMFLVDGRQWLADPFALEHNDDGFGSRNAVLEVRPAADTSGAL
jgi:anti-sigma factor RsiW